MNCPTEIVVAKSVIHERTKWVSEQYYTRTSAQWVWRQKGGQVEAESWRRYVSPSGSYRYVMNYQQSPTNKNNIKTLFFFNKKTINNCYAMKECLLYCVAHGLSWMTWFFHLIDDGFWNSSWWRLRFDVPVLKANHWLTQWLI